jgi:flagellar biosynthesis/type III secretory pathway ATPase
MNFKEWLKLNKDNSIENKDTINETEYNEISQNIIDEAKKKESQYIKKLWKLYKNVYDNLYNLQIHLTNGYTGGKDKENDKANNNLYNITQDLLRGDKLNFITFAKQIEKITV